MFATLILTLLLVSSQWCYSAQQEDTDCGDDRTANNSICYLLFQEFQHAVMSRPANLYNLRKDFFPDSKSSPTLLNVSYEVSFQNISLASCSPADNNTVGSFLHANKGWTSQSLYTRIHPATINRLQPQLMYYIMTAIEPRTSTSGTFDPSLHWQGLKGQKFITLHLFLEIHGLSCSPTLKQIDNTLKDLTSVVCI